MQDPVQDDQRTTEQKKIVKNLTCELAVIKVM